MRFLIIICLMVSLVAEETPNPMPIEGQKILNVLNVKINELKIQAAKDLKKVQDDQTKKNKLDAALAVREQISALEQDVELSTPDAMGEIAPSEKLVLGEWVLDGTWHGHFIVEPSGTMRCITNGDKGTWVIAKKRITFTWSRSTNTYSMPKDLKSDMAGVDGQPGATRVIEKVKP